MPASAGLGLNPQTLLLGLSALGGGLSNRASTMVGSGTNTSTGTQTSSSKINDPELLAMRNMAFQNFQRQLNPASTAGITANKVQNINRNSALQRENLEGILAARGIQGPAAANAVANVESQRFANVTGAQNEDEMLRYQLQQQALQDFGSFINSASVAGQDITQTNTNSTIQNSSQTDPENVLGGVTGNLASTLAFILGQGGFGGFGGGGGIVNDAAKKGLSTAGIGAALGKAGTAVGTLGGLVPLSAGIPIIGAGVGAAVLAKKLIGQGRKQANKLTGEGGLQYNFNEGLADIVAAQQRGEIDDTERTKLVQDLYGQLVQDSRGFASKGKNQDKVVRQMLQSYFTNPVTSAALANTRNQYSQYL